MSGETLRYQDIIEFLYRESELLDTGRLVEWLQLLSPNVMYRIPMRVTVARDSNETGFRDDAYFLNEDIHSLTTRAQRLQSEYAWAEDPRPRMRRFVTNIREIERSDDRISVTSNVLLIRGQGESVGMDIISAQRVDELGTSNGEPRLEQRVAYLDHTVLPAKNFSFFL